MAREFWRGLLQLGSGWLLAASTVLAAGSAGARDEAPEPGTILLVGIGVLAVGLWRRKAPSGRRRVQ